MTGPLAGALPGPLTGGAWVALAAVALAGAALAGALGRLRRRGDRWPPARVAAAVGGLGCLAGAAAVPALVPVATAPATAHAAQHLLAGMVGPLLLALAAPVTLALRTLGPRPRRALLGAVRSRPARVLTTPAAVLVLEVGGLCAVYLTGLAHHLHHDPLLAALVHLHLLGAGYLLALVLAGPDPVPHRLSAPAALLLLVAVAAAHQVVVTVVHARAPDLDGLRGAALMRTGGHLVDAALATAVMTRWYRRTGRELAREQRRTSGAGAPSQRPRPGGAGLRPGSSRWG